MTMAKSLVEINNLLFLHCLVTIVSLCDFTFGNIFHGVRLGDFPPPDFKTTIKAVAAQNGKNSFKRVILPSHFNSVPDLVRVYASTEDGDSSGFRFEGTGACQNPGSNGNYGGVIFAYNSKEVYLWTPTKYSGNTNGKIIFVEDGWGGETYTQSSRVADLTIEAWNSLPTPNFHENIQVDGSKRFYEVPHKLKQIPDFISVRVYSRNSGIFKKDLLFHFHATGSVQTPSGSLEYGGVVFAYNETFVRLWLPQKGIGLRTGCILITKGWGDGKYSKEMNADICLVEIRAWINSFPSPVYQTSWKTIRANAHQKSFREIKHNIGKDVLLVQVQIKQVGTETSHFIYDGLGSIQSTQSAAGTYGGVLFAYDKQRVRIWVASSEIDEKGRAIFVSDAWGNGTHVEEHERALFRVRIYSNMCKSKMQIVDGQGICRDAGQTGLIWQASPWGNCSNVCTNGIQRKKLTGCHAMNMETVFSCDFEKDDCGFTQFHKWRLSMGSAEKELEPDGYMQPPYGFNKGSRFIYAVVKNMPGGSFVHLTSPEITKGKNCHLRFLFNTGVYYNYIEVHVHASGNWRQAWKLSDRQPGDPYIWYHGYLNLESYDVKQFRFHLRLQHSCLKHCGYVAFDDVTLQCEAEEKTLLPLETCEKRETALPGCTIDVLQPLHIGKAFSVVEVNGEKYVKANGTLSQHIATYRFKVEKSDSYTVWIEILGTSKADNSVFYYIDEHMQQTVHPTFIIGKPAWTWNCFNQSIHLAPGTHTVTLRQYDCGFSYRTIIISPRHVTAWSSLGMQSMHINDLQLRSSLIIDNDDAPHLRLNGKGAWATKDANFGWLNWQINFPDVALVSRVAIQGACPHSNRAVCCGAERFKLKFSIDGKDFSYYRNSSQSSYVFRGSNGRTPNYIVESELEYAVPARAVQFYPYNSISYTCLRVEVYGAYITKQMCTHAGIKPNLVRSCVGSRNCGKNAECVLSTDTKGDKKESCRCSPGFHGQFCEHVGCDPNPCRNNGICKLHGGILKCACQPGYTGKLCQTSCPSNKYGPDCIKACRCFGKSRCHPVTGQCICQPGFTGQLCDTPCARGYFGQDCASRCQCSSWTICDPVSGSCYCPIGFYGQFCERKCKSGFYGRNCTTPCQCGRHSTCSPDNGTCICPPGWFGKVCIEECPDGKFGLNCQSDCLCRGNSVCNKRDGSCTCKVGWRGGNCDLRCPRGSFGLGCNVNCSCNWSKADGCDHVTGRCNCKTGFFGLKCNDQCGYGTYGAGCAKRCKCQNDAYCDPVNGECRCRDGFMGNLCQQKCPKGRYGKNCNYVCRCVANNTQVCSNLDGTCDCLPGFKGRKCHKLCKPGFWGKNCNYECQCHHGSHCDRMVGICTCTAGWFGPTCETPCDNGFFGPGCKFVCKCQNNAACDRVNGSCMCSPGFIGKYCDEKCPLWKYGKNCQRDCSCKRDYSSNCSSIDGACFCRDGYHGDNCEKDCPDGKYGPDCRLNCQHCPYHSTGSCNKVTGGCNCSHGYFGDMCQYPCPLDTYGRMCSSLCQCNSMEICNNINGVCFNRSQFEFFSSIQVAGDTVVNDSVFTKLAYNLELLMAKHYALFLQKLSRKRREADELRVHPEIDPGMEKAFLDAGFIGPEKLTDEEYVLVRKILEADKKSNLDSFLDQTSDDSDADYIDLLAHRNLDMNDLGKGGNVESRTPQEASVFEEDQMLYKSDARNSVTSNMGRDLVRRDVANNTETLNCIALSSPSDVSAFSVRVISKEKKFSDSGKVVFKVGLVALYKSKPQEKQLMEKFIKFLPDGCILIGTSCKTCSVYWGGLHNNQPTENRLNTWIIIGIASGGFLVCLALAIYYFIQRKRHSIVPTIYKVEQNSRDIELRPCLANGDGSHVLAFENPYYDVIAAMGLDDDIEEDYYNPLYTYDDVSLYCDDQGSDSGTETNNEDGYQYPYDRDSGISSGTIHQ